jgi:hypothetical protein
MTAYLVDTNVVSEIWKPKPGTNVVAWWTEAEWFLPAPVIAEIQEGIDAGPLSRRAELNAKLDELMRYYDGAILDWTGEVSRTWGRLKHSLEAKRQPQPLWDSLIDAMAHQRGLEVATRNAADFRHSKTFNPWTYKPGSENPSREASP